MSASDLRITDNDAGEITATVNGVEVRGWSYQNAAERRIKMRMAHDFAEGWFQANKRALRIVDDLRNDAPSGSYDNGGTEDGWRMACSEIEAAIGGAM